jgi:hypothetical protein
MDSQNTLREIPDRSITNILDNTYNRKRVKPTDVYEDNENELNIYNDYMLHDNIDDDGDPVIIKGEAHN